MKKASKKKATSVASPHEKNVELKSLARRLRGTGLAGTHEGRHDDYLVLDGPSSINPYQATAQFESEIGERGEISDGSGWHQGEFDFSIEGAQLKPGPVALSTKSLPGRRVEIGDFSLVGF